MQHTISRKANVTLWTVQGILAALFLFAGTMKFVMPVDQMAGTTGLSGTFFHFIGIAEILGAFGLVLPGVLHIRPQLTPLAACGLVCIMTGATVLTITTMGIVPALVPLIAGVLALSVVLGRRSLLSRARLR